MASLAHRPLQLSDGRVGDTDHHLRCIADYDHVLAVLRSAVKHHHDKGRTCERTDEVLKNYRLRAIAAERRLTQLAKESDA